MRGIINVLKPPGMTSHDVISFIRKQLNIKKVGHSGTLDPVAAGVLPVFVGRATKAIEFFEHDDKEYVAEISLGIVTDTGDIVGKILQKREIDVDFHKLNETLLRFTGKISQIPPMYSAVRHNGKKLYELARQGIVVERKPRIVEIKALELINFSEDKVVIKVCCSKGTYIRALALDIGEKLGCGGTLSSLVRTRSGSFNIVDSYTLEEIKENVIGHRLYRILLPVDFALQYLPKVVLSTGVQTFIKGRILPVDTSFLGDEKQVRVYSSCDTFLGIARIEKLNGRMVLRAAKSLQ